MPLPLEGTWFPGWGSGDRERGLKGRKEEGRWGAQRRSRAGQRQIETRHHLMGWGGISTIAGESRDREFCRHEALIKETRLRSHMPWVRRPFADLVSGGPPFFSGTL